MPLSVKQHLEAILAELALNVPENPPIQNFVHHNPLQAYQHLDFEQALRNLKAITGINGYLTEAQFREFHRQGRIDDNDLSAALKRHFKTQLTAPVLRLQDRIVTQEDIYRIALLFELEAILPNQLVWQIEELGALEKFQADIPDAVKQRLLVSNQEYNIVSELWQSILNKLELEQVCLHPENMLDLSLDQAEALLAQHKASINHISRTHFTLHEQMREAVQQSLAQDLQRLGDDLSLRSLIMALCGVDILENVRAQIIRIYGSAMDEGVSAWRLPGLDEFGLYTAWRNLAGYDINPFLQELPDWKTILAECPDDAKDAIILQLNHFEIPQSRWQGYLQRLALEIPGWSSMIHWRQKHPEYAAAGKPQIDLTDYLAIRLTLDRLWLNQVCRDTWQIEAKLSSIKMYFRKNASEYMVRSHLFRGDLPEYLIEKAETMTTNVGSERYNKTDWQQLADMIWTWQSSLMTGYRHIHSLRAPGSSIPPLSSRASVYESGWRLFRLCQHLGLSAQHLQAIGKTQLQGLLGVLDAFDAMQRRQLWLEAYEHHYREALFLALERNHQPDPGAHQTLRPSAQIIFCMDGREESIRRHLEERDANLQTFGAPGFFGFAMHYRGLDDPVSTAYCPSNIQSRHEVREVPKAHTSPAILEQYRQKRCFKKSVRILLLHSLRRNLVLSPVLMIVMAPFIVPVLCAKVFFPKALQTCTEKIINAWNPKIPTTLLISAPAPKSSLNPVECACPFSDNEQAELLKAFLRRIGLSKILSRFIVFIGHSSLPQNNAHFALYACDACRGQRSGPNARSFAAIANRPEIRQLLADKGLIIPQDTWFIGAEHDTCEDALRWYDLENLPSQHQAEFATLQNHFDAACQLSAFERCRHLAAAPRNPALNQAIGHVRTRACDFSEAHPEFAHAANAAALIGRRAMSRGLFLERRAFLISYDPSQDHDGAILESILLEAVPLVAGVNLEYYFSTVNQQYFGSGSQTLHNIIGLIGVMEGANSDLRTGLPKQMTGVHEAMRLQLIVETKIKLFEQIYARQPSLRELIGNSWVHLSCQDPDNGYLYTFTRDQGFVLWRSMQTPGLYPESSDDFKGQDLFTSAALNTTSGVKVGATHRSVYLAHCMHSLPDA